MIGSVKMTKSISVLGSTGSIGTQTLDVARMHNIKVAEVSKRGESLEKQAREFKPNLVCVIDKSCALSLKAALADTDIEVISGEEGVIQAATESSCDTVVNAIVGVAGLLPTISAIKAGKNLALANKETLVAGGSIVMKAVKDYGVKLYPVDSEHSAIFQC